MSVAGDELQHNREGMGRLPRDTDPETYVRASAGPSVCPSPR